MTSLASLRSYFPLSHRVYTPDAKLPATTQNFERTGFRAGAVVGEACALLPRLLVGFDVRAPGPTPPARQPLRATGLFGLVQSGLTGGASILGVGLGCALGLATLPLAPLRSSPWRAHMQQAMALGARMGAYLVSAPVQGLEATRVMGAFALGFATLLIAHCGAVLGGAISELFIERPRALEA